MKYRFGQHHNRTRGITGATPIGRDRSQFKTLEMAEYYTVDGISFVLCMDSPTAGRFPILTPM